MNNKRNRLVDVLFIVVVGLSAMTGTLVGLKGANQPDSDANTRLSAPHHIYAAVTGLVADANPDGGGTDNAPVIQNLINTALAAGLPVQLPPGRYAINSTIHISPATNFTFSGSPAGRLGPDDLSRGTWLVWNGPKNGTMIDIGGIKCAITDLGLCSARSTSVDVCIDVESPSAPPWVSSQHKFENIVCYGMVGSVKIGWQVGADQKSNNEFHWWRSCCTRYCTYAGISVPNSTRQAKDLVAEDCTFGGNGQFNDYGVVFNSGSMHFWRCNWDSLGCATAWFGGSNESIDFINCTGETNRRFGQFTGCLNANFQGCRLNLIAASNPQVQGQEFISGAGNVTFTGCVFEEADNLDNFLSSSNGPIVVSACQFHSKSPISSDDHIRCWPYPIGMRVDQGNNLVPFGPYYQRNVRPISHAGNGILFTDGHWPPKGNWQGGEYVPNNNEGRLYTDSGKLWWAVGNKPPKEVQLVTPP